MSLAERSAQASVKMSTKNPSKVFNPEHGKSFSYGSLNLDLEFFLLKSLRKIIIIIF